ISDLRFVMILFTFVLTSILLVSVRPALAQTSNYALIVSSASGNSEFKEKFWNWSSQMAQVLKDEMRIPREHIILLTEDPSVNPALANGKATKAELAKAFETLQAKMPAGARLLVFLVGHGSFDSVDYKFNLVGPDATGAEFKGWLDRFEKRQLVLVSTTPCSGVLTKTLSHNGRVIITATKSEFENNDTIFAQFFVEAFKNKAADNDKNSEVSMLEAYLYAAQRVESWYKEQGRLATEHPLLEDSGDAAGVARPSPSNGEGLLAAKVSLHPRAGAPANTGGALAASPELQGLGAEKQRLEGAIQDLKYKKAALTEAEYNKQLESLLIQLAQTNQKINAAKKK
ncbi:MAG: hypothetical protein L0312_08580, partial [Acidobacteria bacterium]|nr:hypothetical protein [Acidobacteriota bacterium]